MQAGHYASLLPELFRHKTTRIRVFQPKAILLDFHGTISERRWEDKVIYPYVKRAVSGYLRDNWSSELVQKCIPGLRNESFEQRFRHKYEDAPIVDDHERPGEDLDPVRLAGQLGDFLHWQMATKRETRETQIIERLVWQDGFRRGKILLPLYEDVAPSIKLWHNKYNCSIYIISSIDGETLKLLFENTVSGNLDENISGYVSSTKMGDKMISDTYKRFHDRLQSKGIVGAREESIRAATNSPKAPKSPTIGSNPKPSSPTASLGRQQLADSINLSTGSLNETIRPILFITDSGQEAKAASRVNDAFECVIINRPGNKRIRTYYLSQFQYVETFNDIEFV